MSLAQKVRDVTDVVGSLSDVAGPSAWAKKIKIDSSCPKVTKERAIFLCHHEYASSLSCYPYSSNKKSLLKGANEVPFNNVRCC